MSEKSQSWEVLKASVERVGAKAVAAHLKVSQALVYKWCEKPRDDDNEDGEVGSGARNPLDRVLGVVEATEDNALVRWMCEQAGGFFTPNPDHIGDVAISSIDFLDKTQAMIQQFSDLLRVLTESKNNDGRIDTDESKKIRGSWEELKGQVESLVVACERGLFDQFDKDGKRMPPRR
ncbi:MAG: hypothetical protein AB7K09_17965 [Planctomycetota bacterium]